MASFLSELDEGFDAAEDLHLDIEGELVNYQTASAAQRDRQEATRSMGLELARLRHPESREQQVNEPPSK